LCGLWWPLVLNPLVLNTTALHNGITALDATKLFYHPGRRDARGRAC